MNESHSHSKLKSWLHRTDWENWINIFLGAWVLLLPWTVGYGFHPFNVNVVSWNFVIMGVVVIVMSWMSLKSVTAFAEWLVLFAGIWLFFSPWILLYEDNSPWYAFYNENNALLWNSIISGALITIFAALTIPVVEKIVYKKHINRHPERPLFWGNPHQRV